MKARITFEREVEDENEGKEWTTAVAMALYSNREAEGPDNYFYEFVDDE